MTLQQPDETACPRNTRSTDTVGSPQTGKPVDLQVVTESVDSGDILLSNSTDPTVRTHWRRTLNTTYAILRRHRFPIGTSLVVFCVLLGAGLAISVVFLNAREDQLRDEALGLAEETGEWFSSQLDQAILPLFSIAQFAVELPLFRGLPSQIGPPGEAGSLPFMPPPEEGGSYTHRNITGICDEPALVARFDEIAATIKKHAKQEGVLVNIQLAPQAVVCLLYPLNNTEDFPDGVFMDNTGARGLDLLVDPFSSFIAKQSIPQDDVIIAGPLTLRQCRDSSCDATVEKAFIARLPIAVPDYTMVIDGVPHNKWGFATALINWEALVEKSDIYETFEHRNMEFRLTRTDRNFDALTNSYTENVVILAETPGYKDENSSRGVTSALQTTNNEWEITVIYDDASLNSVEALGMTACVILAFSIAALTCVVLRQRQSQHEMKALSLAQETKVDTERNMTAYFAHELRNPLGAIDSALGAMPDDLPDSVKELVGGMRLCSGFMSSIMNNLLDVRKMEEGKMTLEQKPMSLYQLNSTVHMMLMPSVSKSVKFLNVCETEANDWVKGDSHRLQQVMTNVVTNAIKHTKSGSITLKMSWEGRFVKFECIDTGPGIPIEEQEVVFERYYMSGQAPGTGLGLAISKHVVTLMGGTIHFESDPTVEPGTNCVVKVPLSPCSEPIPTTLDQSEALPLEQEVSILIVDDVTMNKLMLGRRIKKGIAPKAIITEASTGEEALEICATLSFDVIVVDQYMEAAGGVLLGTEVVSKMRESGIDAVIIGSSGNELDDEFLAAGADLVWQKPIPKNETIIKELRARLSVDSLPA